MTTKTARVNKAQKEQKATQQSFEAQALGAADPSRVAAAMRKLAVASSANVGTDCYIHAAIGQAILSRLNIDAQLVIGYAAWRVGPGDGDILVHAPVPNLPAQPGAEPYHVWLEIGNLVFDLTTYQLRSKAANLDRLDGRHTEVRWCSDYLLVAKNTCASLPEVVNAYKWTYHYARNDAVAKRVKVLRALDPDDVEMALWLYNAPNAHIIGPNSLRTEE